MRDREYIWSSFLGSISGKHDRETDNSYLSLEEEPSNAHDPNAVMVVCRGEHFGTVGYVGKEYAKEVKEILAKANAYRVDMLEEKIEKEIELVMTWR
ncbi:MAG: HIRAN domain-containing protein [Brevinema sp.]